MSIPLMGLVWTSTMRDATEVAVLSCLASHANDDGESCFAGLPRIAKLVRRSKRTTQRTIDALEAGGWITVVRGDGAGNLTRYEINVDRLKGCQDDTLCGKAKKVTSAPQRVTLATEKGDIGDNPPDPLLGRNVKANVKATNPSGEEPKIPAPQDPEPKPEPSPETGPEPRPEPMPGEFTPEQLAHLQNLPRTGRYAENWRSYYAQKNREACQAAAEKAEARAVLDAVTAELRAMYPNRESAIKRLRKQCGFAWARGDLLGPVIEQVFLDQEELGREPWQIAAGIVAMWKLRSKHGWRYGPMAFFRNGAWMGDGAGSSG